MGLRERFRLEEIEGDSLLYVPPLSLQERSESEELQGSSEKKEVEEIEEVLSEA